METVPSAPGNEVPNPDSVKSEDGNLTQGSGRASPPPNCAICLGTCRNKSFTDSCLHQFCFKCLLTWSKVKAVCPLCKQNFRSIIHNVRSNHQYEEYVVEQRSEGSSDRGDLDGNASRTFIYRTTLTVQPHESIAIQQLLLQHYPMMANVFPAPARRRRSPSLFRRTVYRHNLWARPLPDFTGRFRDCTPDFYRYNQTQMHRLMPWMNRELFYLLNENQRHINFVMSRILELLQMYHINSPEFRDALHRYFGDRTEHFLHELYCFASTPYDLTGYDRNVQYTTGPRVSTMINEVDSGSESESSADSDIIMISSSVPPVSPPGPSRLTRSARVPVYPQNYIPNPSTNNVIPIETISHSDTDDDSEVMVVGYIKPPQDRTPEIVDLLGSDSDVIVQDTPQPEPANNPECSEYRPNPLVKLSLRCHRPRENRESDSEDSSYRPPRPRRKRRMKSADTATTTDTNRTTPSPATLADPQSATSVPSTSSSSSSSSSPSSSSSSSTSSSSATTSYSFHGNTSTDSYDSGEEKRKTLKRKLKRKKSSERSKKKSKRSKSRSHHKESKVPQNSSDKSSKRKSHSGKGVKSSNKSNGLTIVANLNADKPQSNGEPIASTSGTSSHGTLHPENRKDSRPSHERKRLKSVVRVIRDKKTVEAPCDRTENLHSNATQNPSTSRLSHEDERSRYPNEDPKNTIASPSHTPPHDSSDSDDNLPLNITIQKMKSIKVNNARNGLDNNKHTHKNK